MPSLGNPLTTLTRERAQRHLQARFAALIEKVRQTRPGEGSELVRRAFLVAAEQHKDQVRQSGEPFLSHPLEVAHILADMKLDVTTICAALLHDIVEDTRVTLAHRLGMGLIRNELEDMAFRYLEPSAYLELSKQVASKSKFHEKFLSEVQETIRKKLVENSIPAEVEGRIKGLYSIHRKIQRQQRPLEQIYDLLAVRVISDSERSCYAAVGVIHQIWRPVPGRFKDYIAGAHPNLYQSLHTTVIHAGQPFEVQIRTQEMHRLAEQGVAAHWKYKDGKDVSDADDRRIVWMRQLIEWVQEMQEPGDFLSTLRVDLHPVEVYAFTPKGRVIELQRGATPVDFAYAVHTE